MAKTGEGLNNEVYVLPGVLPPVYSGEEGSRSEDLRPVQIVPKENLPEGAVIVNDPEDGVIIHLR